MLHIFLLLLLFLAIELIYFRFADYLNIVDKPNERSSHVAVTIRGGGVIFPIAFLCYSLFNHFVYPWVTIGLLAISVISLLDDRQALSSRFRFAIHFVAFTLCFIQLNLFEVLPWWMIPVVYIVGIGCVNAVNFMDGINGMTGLYSLAVFIPAQWFFYHQFWNNSIFNYLTLAILVFGFFNFRIKARCFAGDVGSVSMGYILVFFLLGFIFNRFEVTENIASLSISNRLDFTLEIKYLLLLSLYGVDTISTLVQRIYLKENIFEAHRRHLYQLMCNEYRTPHVLVSGGYAGIQMLISFYIFNSLVSNLDVLVFLLVMTTLYAFIKYFLLSSRSIA